MHQFGDADVFQEWFQRSVHARRQRVDQQHFAGHGQLHQRQLGKVGALPDEFGIHGHHGLALPGCQARGQQLRLVYPVVHLGLIAKRRQVSLSPIRPRLKRAQGFPPCLACDTV